MSFYLRVRGGRGVVSARRRRTVPAMFARPVAVIVALVGFSAFEADHATAQQPPTGRNVVIFIADGLRPGSVNPSTAPNLSFIRQNGVFFSNSHAVFPTFTTPNGAAIATGHFPGDTGDFSNTIYSGYPVFAVQKVAGIAMALATGTITPFVENDPVLADLNAHFGGANGFLSEDSLLSLARKAGYNTATIGKVGPALIQDVTQGNVSPATGTVPVPTTVVIDDSTGNVGGVPLNASIIARLNAAGIGTQAPGRGANAPSGNNATPGTLVPNAVQQQYFVQATTSAVLPAFAASGKPFVLAYWSRDPDGTQHNQGDSLNSLVPGINGPTSMAAVQNADSNLGQIMAALNALGLAANTDIFVTADHGFATISRQPVDALGTPTKAYSATLSYPGVNPGFLPPGFLAIDLAHDLALPLYDSNVLPNAQPGLDVHYSAIVPTQGQRPSGGNALIGGTGTYSVATSSTDAQVVIASNGGSDLVYLPQGIGNGQLLQNVVRSLLAKDYVSGLFVDENLGPVPAGTLPMSDIQLSGTTNLPKPAVVVNFRSFSTDPTNPLMTGVTVADTTLQQGQGMHGTIGRHDTSNNMAAYGPDFKQGFVDQSPVSNTDIMPTIASILGLTSNPVGVLAGRRLDEALVGGPSNVLTNYGIQYSAADTQTGLRTFLAFQQVGNHMYYDAAGFAGESVGLPVLAGTTGSDVLFAGATYWALDGLAGNDTLVGGPGKTTMLGGPGADLFVLDRGNGTNTIGDFSRADGDKIGLTAGLTYATLSLRADGQGNTQIFQARVGRLLGVVMGVAPGDLGAGDFVAY